MRIMCLDIGEKRIGVAVSDPLGITAQGLDVIQRQGLKSVYQIRRLLMIIRLKVILGYP